MPNKIHQQNIFLRYGHYSVLASIEPEPRNYNIAALRVFKDLEKEQNSFLLGVAYQMFQATLKQCPDAIKPETVTAFIGLIATEINARKRYTQFELIKLVLNKPSGKHFCTRELGNALAAALHTEQESMKPLQPGTMHRAQCAVVANCLQEIIDQVDGELRSQITKGRQQSRPSGPPRS